MSRVWQEGFESGVPNGYYYYNTPNPEQIDGLSSTSLRSMGASNSWIGGFPGISLLDTGRNSLSKYSLKLLASNSGDSAVFIKRLTTTLNSFFLRFWFKHDILHSVTTTGSLFALMDSSGYQRISIQSNGLTSFILKVYVAGVETTIGTFTLTNNTWYKIDIKYIEDTSIGEYDLKINDLSIFSGTNINTGSGYISSIKFGFNIVNANLNATTWFDDIALNDTNGSKNNTWCGSGSIVGLKPKTQGSYAQFDCKGYVAGESGTTTTNIKITGHGLSTNDVIYNITLDAYRIVTVVDADNLTVSSVTGQTTGNLFSTFTYVATITGTTNTGTSYVEIPGHNLSSGDVIVNTTRSNAIRKVIATYGSICYHYYSSSFFLFDELSLSTSSQQSGDSIKTFKLKQYPVTNHYSVVNLNRPKPTYGNIYSNTVGEKETFNLEELVADKLLSASNTTIVAVSHCCYARENGAGSTYQPLFVISSVDCLGSTITLTSSCKDYQQIFENSPSTGITWTVSELDGCEVGLKVV